MSINAIGGAAFSLFANHIDEPKQAVPVILPDKYAGAETEAGALLSSLGFHKEDVQAYQEQYGVNLTDKFTTEFRAGKHNYNAGERFYDQKSQSYKFKAYISVNESYYKHLKTFVAERRTSAQASASGVGGKIG